MRPTVNFIGFAILCLSGSDLAHGADIDNGKTIASRWCTSCHLIAPEQSQASADVPSFASIANRADFNAQQIATFLLDPHPKMPSFGLSRKEAEDISEYIASLAGKQRQDHKQI